MFDFIREYLRDRRRSKTFYKAFRLAGDNKFTEAAEIFIGLANESLQYNELIYSGDCQYAFKYFLQAGDMPRALEQARNALRVLSLKEWTIKSESSIEKLSAMVGALYLAGYGAEAEAFSDEVNEQLKIHGLSIRVSASAAGYKASLEGNPKLVKTCSQCGGKLPASSGGEIKCLYCGSIAGI